MEWRGDWLLAGLAGLVGLSLLRGLLKLLSPVAAVGVVAYGIGVLLHRREQTVEPEI